MLFKENSLLPAIGVLKEFLADGLHHNRPRSLPRKFRSVILQFDALFRFVEVILQLWLYLQLVGSKHIHGPIGSKLRTNSPNPFTLYLASRKSDHNQDKHPSCYG